MVAMPTGGGGSEVDALFAEAAATFGMFKGQASTLKRHDPQWSATLLAMVVRWLEEERTTASADVPPASAPASEDASVYPGSNAALIEPADANAEQEAADRAEVEARPWLYTKKAIDPRVIEFLTLRHLELQGEERCEKADIYNVLKHSEGFKIGSYAAFCTKLDEFKKAELIDWKKGGQNAAITITKKGLDYRQELVKPGRNSLKGVQRDCLAKTLTWSGLEAPVAPEILAVRRVAR